jgi:hypothetical protein
MPINQINANEQKEFSEFIGPVINSIIQYHNINPELIADLNHRSFHFADAEHYGEVMHSIDPNATYTNDGKNRCFGKFIPKDGKNFIILRREILTKLIESEYKNGFMKYIIYHEIGHCIHHLINPNFPQLDKYSGLHSLIDISKYILSIAIDEYIANNYIAFLLTKEDCDEILFGNTLYADIENLYLDIPDQLDLFTRFWNNSNSIPINLFKHIPLFQKNDWFKETEVLKILNIKSIIADLNEPERRYDIIHNQLVSAYNAIVADYNSDNPPVLQKGIETR